MASADTVVQLTPGGISKPQRAWCSSTSVRISFYQAHPISASFSVFYKKSGSVFGAEVTTPSSAIIGPELSVKQPTSIDAQYFEMDLRKLKPNTQYLVKVKTTNGRLNARSDKISTISVEEQRKRDADMSNFGGALVKLSDYDGSVLRFERETGLFHIRILQIDDVRNATQLLRLQSDYSDSGLPVNAYTLSQVKFGRWGGEIHSSKVVPEGELKWIVARAVQLEERSESRDGYDARTRLLQLQTEKLQTQLQQDGLAQVKKLRFQNLLYLVLATCLALLVLLGTSYTHMQASWTQSSFDRELSLTRDAASELQVQVEQLQLYRVSMEVDSDWRLEPGDSCDAWQAHLQDAQQATAAATAPVNGSTATNSSSDTEQQQQAQAGHKAEQQEMQKQRGRNGAAAQWGAGGAKRETSNSGSGRPHAGGKGGGGASRTPAAPGSGTLPEAQRLMGDPQIKRMLRRSHHPPEDVVGPEGWVGPVPEEEPHAWSFIHQVSNQYALHVQEWMKVQLSKTIRSKVNEMLASAEEQDGSGGEEGAAGEFC